MDDRKIRSLLTVIETGSISSAAEHLNGTQSGITQAMNALEAELGFKVLVRTNRGVSLTEAGAKILPTLQLLDETFRTLEREAKEIAEGKGVTIRIGTYSSVANTWLPEMMSKYARTNPDTAFDILVGSDKLSRWLQKGKVDMLLVDEAIGKEFRWYPIMEDEFKAAVPLNSVIAQKTSVTLDDLQQYHMIVGTLNTYRKLREIPDGMANKVIRVNADDDTTIIRMVSNGLGVSVMAGLSLVSVPDNVRIIPLDPPVPRLLGAALPQQASGAAKRFTEFLIRNERGASASKSSGAVL